MTTLQAAQFILDRQLTISNLPPLSDSGIDTAAGTLGQ